MQSPLKTIRLDLASSFSLKGHWLNPGVRKCAVAHRTTNIGSDSSKNDQCAFHARRADPVRFRLRAGCPAQRGSVRHPSVFFSCGSAGGRGNWRRLRPGRVPMWKLNPITIRLLVNKIKQTLRDSFSALSNPNFESKYSFESSWRDLQDIHAFAPQTSIFQQNFVDFFWRFQY